MVVLSGCSLAGVALMNEKGGIFFFSSLPLFWSSMDREWPVAINVDQPKLLPLLQSDRVGSEKGV